MAKIAIGKQKWENKAKTEWQNETKGKVFHLYCKASVIVVVESLHLKEVDCEEIFRSRADLLFLIDCAAK